MTSAVRNKSVCFYWCNIVAEMPSANHAQSATKCPCTERLGKAKARTHFHRSLLQPAQDESLFRQISHKANEVKDWRLRYDKGHFSPVREGFHMRDGSKNAQDLP